MQPWPAPPPGQNYINYELSNVFSANGLTPQVSFAAKGQSQRYTSGGGGGHRNSNVRNKRTSNMSSSGTDHRSQHMPNNVGGNSSSAEHQPSHRGGQVWV